MKMEQSNLKSEQTWKISLLLRDEEEPTSWSNLTIRFQINSFEDLNQLETQNWNQMETVKFLFMLQNGFVSTY